MAASRDGEIVLVTGGCGFLGQSLVQHLQEHEDTIREIRVLDVRPYTDSTDSKHTTPIVSYVGDLRRPSDVQEAVAGCTSVFHTASVIQVGVGVDKDFVYDVNVKGTENIIQACLDQNVSRFIYTGSVDAFKVFKHELNVSEETAIYRDASELAFPEYGGSKMRAEQLVIQAHGKKTKSGEATLNTVVIRPTGIYGEGNVQHGPAELLRNTKRRGGVLAPVEGMRDVLWPLTYVGNVAWAHVMTWRALKKTTSIGGQGYFITDDTPVTNYVDFNRKFIDACGFKISNRTLPKFIVLAIAYIIVFVCALAKPFKQIKTDFSPRTVWYMSYSQTYDGGKLRKVTGYKPLYSAEEALERSVEFYKSIIL